MKVKLNLIANHVSGVQQKTHSCTQDMFSVGKSPSVCADLFIRHKDIILVL